MYKKTIKKWYDSLEDMWRGEERGRKITFIAFPVVVLPYELEKPTTTPDKYH